MNQIELNDGLNIRAALIFLNLFGLTLEESEDLKKTIQSLRIYNKQGKTVGHLTINQRYIKIVATSNFGHMVANYDIPRINSLKDEEAPLKPALFTSWSNSINYSIINNSKEIKGEIKIDCSMDTHIGLACSCHPYLEYSDRSGTKINLNIQRDGNIFYLEIIEPNKIESIKLSTFDYLFSHSVKKKATGNKNDSYLKLINLADLPEDDKFRVTTIIQENGVTTEITNKKFADEENYHQSLIKKGQIMQELDPEMYKKIKIVESILKKDSISIVNNFISASLTNYSEEQISAMLGLERNKALYQGGHESIEGAYFGLVEGQKTYKLPIKKDITSK